MIGYAFRNLREDSSGFHGELKLLAPVTPSYGEDVVLLNFDIVNVRENCIKINISNQIAKPGQSVPDCVFQRPVVKPVKLSDSNFNIFIDTMNRNFYLTRKGEENNPLFGFSFASLVFKEQYVEVNVRVPENANIYGFGEVVDSFRRNPNNSTTTIFSRDCPCTPGENLYGAHPYYMEVRNNKAHGVLLLNSHGLDVKLSPENISYCILGGNLEFYVFSGPTPLDVCRQYTSFIGKPILPPYWALGFHQCRFGYENLDSLKKVIKKYEDNELPLDCLWTDIDHMRNFKDFTFDEKRYPQNEMAKFANELHEKNKKFVAIVDPCISVDQEYEPYVSGSKKNIWIKIKAKKEVDKDESTDEVDFMDEDDEDEKAFIYNRDEIVEIPFIGQVWPGKSVFPDFFHPKTQEWWTGVIKNWLNQVPFDGIWIDMNEIANFTNGFRFKSINTSDWADRRTGLSRYLTKFSKNFVNLLMLNSKDDDYKGPMPVDGNNGCPFDNPPYKINNGLNHLPLNNKTISMGAIHYDGIREYDVHNVFGHMESIATYKALTEINKDKRPFILSRSTFVGTGAFAAHWLADNVSTWESMKQSIAGMLNFQIFGIPMVGADICGFNCSADVKLCCRWMQLGVFYPFARNHNGIRYKSQEPYTSKLLCDVSRKALKLRYELIPYWYTLFYYANATGEPVVRSLWMEFPEDNDTLNNESQFFVGSGLMVTPVLTPDATTVQAYIPENCELYNWITGKKLNSLDTSGNYYVLNAPIDTIPLHIRGGYIIPTQEAGLTTAESRTKPYTLTIALNIEGCAYGSIYLDDGYSSDVKNECSLTEFKFENYTLTCIPKYSGYSPMARINRIRIFGISFENYYPELFFDNRSHNPPVISYDSDENVALFSNLNLSINKPWSFNLKKH